MWTRGGGTLGPSFVVVEGKAAFDGVRRGVGVGVDGPDDYRFQDVMSTTRWDQSL